MENDTSTAVVTAEPVETQQPQPAQPEAAAEPQPDPKAAVFAELGIDGIEAFNQLKETAEAAETYKSELEAANKTNSILQANIEALNLGANPETAAELAEIALGKVTKDTDIKSVMSTLKNSAAYSGFFKNTKILRNTGTPVSNQSKPLPPAENYGASSDALEKFENIVAPIYEKMFHNNKESTILSAYRDTLLPKLMNGEIDVSNVNI